MSQRVAIVFAALMLWGPFLQAEEPRESQPEQTKQSKQTRLGLAVPLSGEFAPLGRQLLESAQLAAREVSVALVVEDSEGTPEGATRAILRLDQADVDAVFGPVGQRESMAGAALAQRRALPLFALGGDHRIEMLKGWIFRARLSARDHGALAAQNAYQKRELRRVGVVYPESAFGRATTTAFLERFKTLGGELVAVGSYPEDTTNFTWHLRELVGKASRVPSDAKRAGLSVNRYGYTRRSGRANVGFDALFIPDSHIRVARLLTFLPLAGIQNGDGGDGVAVTLLGISNWRGSAMKMSKGVAAGALILDTFAGESAGGRAEEFDRTYQEATGRRASSIEAELFDLVWMVGTLSKGLNVTSREERRRELVRALPRERSWNGVAGSLRFGANGEPVRGLTELRFDTDGLVVPTQ